MFKLTFLGKSVYGETLEEAKANLLDLVVNPASIAYETDGYTVQLGDTMYSIAYNLYGCGERWRSIAKLNRKTVRNAKDIRPGMVLKLPAFM